MVVGDTEAMQSELQWASVSGYVGADSTNQ
jgi:hypothetical protein